jgi:hypothetical protein
MRPNRYHEDERREGSLLRVSCEPGSKVLEPMLHFLNEYSKTRFVPGVAERVSVAGYELLANGLNYASVNSEVVFELWKRQSELQVVVTNEAIASRVRMLSGHFQKLKSGAEAVYLEELRRSVSGGFPRPMLGLARVVHEAKMALDVVVNGDTKVTAMASCTL